MRSYVRALEGTQLGSNRRVRRPERPFTLSPNRVREARKARAGQASGEIRSGTPPFRLSPGHDPSYGFDARMRRQSKARLCRTSTPSARKAEGYPHWCHANAILKWSQRRHGTRPKLVHLCPVVSSARYVERQRWLMRKYPNISRAALR